MSTLADRIRTRVLPALLMALGVTFIAAGLLSYGQLADAGGTAVSSGRPVGTGGPTAVPTSQPSVAPTSSSTPASSPVSSGGPTPPPADRVATRVVVPALGIDLPVVRPLGGADVYPLCDVAMYIQELAQPGLAGATYLYAHAREGMFLPLLEESRVNDGARLIGMLVEVYTSDDQLFLYEIAAVHRHVLTLDDAMAAGTQQLWLQTSEGPRGTPEKLQVVALPLSDGPADPVEAHPDAKPVACG